MISEENFLDITLNRNVASGASNWEKWSPNYGPPCIKEEYSFGNVHHVAVLATHGAKFYGREKNGSELYNYWTYWIFPKAAIESNIYGFKDNNYKFDPIVGTYIHESSNEIAYYVPNNPVEQESGWMDIGRVVTVNGKVKTELEKQHYYPNTYNNGCEFGDEYCSEKNSVKHILGYPIQFISPTAESIAKTTGNYQEFIGRGQIYVKNNLLGKDGKAYYIPGEMVKFYDHIDQCRIINNGDPQCGTGGILGFPIGNPRSITGSSIFQQEFEEATLEYIKSSDDSFIVEQTTDGRRFQNKEYARKLFNEVIAGEITDVEAFAELSSYLSSRINITEEEFIKDLTMVLVGAERIYSYGLKTNFERATFGLYDPNFPYRILGFNDSGFKFIYNDSHYCTNPDLDCYSNQLFHSMLGLSVSYFNSREAADKKTDSHDKNPSPLGANGHCQEDISLGYKMAELGEKLRDNTLEMYEVDEWILNNISVSPNIGDSAYDYLRVPLDNVLELAEYRQKFRIFEFEFSGQNGGEDVAQNWLYTKDMRTHTCASGQEIYIQDYLIFMYNGTSAYLYPTLVWDENEEEMIFIPSSRPDNTTICNNLSVYPNRFSLTMTFREMLTEIGHKF